MAFRFRRTLKLLPGVRLNLGKRGISASVGRRGASLTASPDRNARVNVGVPGTGVSFSKEIADNTPPEESPYRRRLSAWWLVAGGIVLVLAVRACVA